MLDFEKFLPGSDNFHLHVSYEYIYKHVISSLYQNNQIIQTGGLQQV